MNPKLYEAASKSADFIQQYHPQAKEWDDVIGYCAWYISHGFMSAMHDRNGEIVALACVRPVNDPQDGNIPYKYCEGGDCIYVDFLAISGHDVLALPAFGMLLFQRFGPRSQIAYTRVRTQNYDNFLRNMGRIKIMGESRIV
jgi:hypothetical protein